MTGMIALWLRFGLPAARSREKVDIVVSKCLHLLKESRIADIDVEIGESLEVWL